MFLAPLRPQFLTRFSSSQILLKGAPGDELKRVKRVTQFAAFAAYHLSLETSFLADEGATLPTTSTSAFLESLRSARPELHIQPSPSASSGGEYLTGSFSQNSPHLTSDGHSARLRLPRHQALPILSVSPNVSFPPEESPDTPNSHKWPSEHPPGGDNHATLGPLSVSGVSSASSFANLTALQPASPKSLLVQQGATPTPPPEGAPVSMRESAPTLPTSKTDEFRPPLVLPEAAARTPLRSTLSHDLKQTVTNGSAAAPLPQSKEQEASSPLLLLPPATPLRVTSPPPKSLANGSLVLDAVSDACGTPRSSGKVAPSPSEHQSILVSLSSRCITKGIVCDRAHLVRIKYYGSTDMPLGCFLRNGLFNTVCGLSGRLQRTAALGCEWT
jgi:1-phosphatidylinositol-3-phosphate 5-kinase